MTHNSIRMTGLYNRFPRAQAGWGYDFRRNMSVAWGDYGSYATDIFTKEAAQAGATPPAPKPVLSSDVTAGLRQLIFQLIYGMITDH